VGLEKQLLPHLAVRVAVLVAPAARPLLPRGVPTKLRPSLQTSPHLLLLLLVTPSQCLLQTLTS
jgi:hypothetical protein